MKALGTIGQDVARMRGVTFADMLSRGRNRALVQPRHEAFFFARELTAASLTMIGRHLGGRDHTTVFNGWRLVQDRRDAEPAYAAELSTMTAVIEGHLRRQAPLLVQPPAGDEQVADALGSALDRAELEARIEHLEADLARATTALRSAEAAAKSTSVGSPKAVLRAFRDFETERYGRGEALAMRRLIEALTDFRAFRDDREGRS